MFGCDHRLKYYLDSSSAKSIHADTPNVDDSGLYPLQALIRPVTLRFKYHFEGPRQTNRVDKVCDLMVCMRKILTILSSLSGILAIS